MACVWEASLPKQRAELTVHSCLVTSFCVARTSLPSTQGPSRWPFESTLALGRAISWHLITPMLSLSTCTRPQCLRFCDCGSLSRTGKLNAGSNFGRGRYSVYSLAHSLTRCDHTHGHSDPCAAASQACSHSLSPFHMGKACLRCAGSRVPTGTAKAAMHPHLLHPPLSFRSKPHAPNNDEVIEGRQRGGP